MLSLNNLRKIVDENEIEKVSKEFPSKECDSEFTFQIDVQLNTLK